MYSVGHIMRLCLVLVHTGLLSTDPYHDSIGTCGGRQSAYCRLRGKIAEQARPNSDG